MKTKNSAISAKLLKKCSHVTDDDTANGGYASGDTIGRYSIDADEMHNRSDEMHLRSVVCTADNGGASGEPDIMQLSGGAVSCDIFSFVGLSPLNLPCTDGDGTE